MWKRKKDKTWGIRTEADRGWHLVALFTLLILVSLTIYPVSYVSSERGITITVIEKHISGESLHIVTDRGTFEVSDSIWYGKWDGRERFDSLELGYTYDVRVAGWHFPDLDMAPNVIKVVE